MTLSLEIFITINSETMFGKLANILGLILLTIISVYSQPKLKSDIDSLLGETEMYTGRFLPDVEFINPIDNIDGFFDYGDHKVVENEGALKTWVLAEESVHGDMFPDATIASIQENQARESFYKIDQDSNFVQIGRFLLDNDGNDAFQYYQNPITVVRASESWGSEYIDTSESNIVTIYDTTFYTRYHTHQMIGYGEVETPEGNYKDCLIELVQTVDQNGETFLDMYKFYHKTLHNKILEIVLRSNPPDEILTLYYKSDNDSVPTSTVEEEIKKISKVRLFQNELLFNSSEDSEASIQLFNQATQHIFSTNINIKETKNIVEIPVQLNDEPYLIIFMHSDGSFESHKILSRR